MASETIALNLVDRGTRAIGDRLHDWVVTVDHKRLGILYILRAFVPRHWRYRSHDYTDTARRSAQPLRFAPSFQPHVYDAWHNDDLFRVHADAVRLRDLF